ncbi:cobalamin-binding protein [Anaeromyxobacter dehalogenans]|uniref:ABC transporter, periplasmic ligand binding protein n=1 Tax=Anaeromyxobacter dehalogenans (strain 2CP-C) TaxID=290397 RepID=Q2IGT5_ANADE|nr:cobalamin-binding protein [Anaeromyxobacter dehalogenans]ABC83794.1 ABC transporter, periplasmic ligand binding protein [Anaeromyxobacter dehalogenans 2CP-C]
MDLAALLSQAPPHPRRVVCLTEETTETLYRIGAGDLVVGVSGFTVRPPEARRKPRVSAFLSADGDAIAALRPDLVVGFSDLQADVARDLVRRGIPVLVTNQRSVAEILQTLRLVTAAVGRGEAGEALAAELEGGLARVAESAAALPRRPRVFFEEWPDPLIAGIRWVSELLELAGAEDVCAETRASHAAKGRIVAPEEVARRAPEAVVASWCGKKARREVIRARPGWADVPAVRDDQLYELRSAIILQPGPAALTDGVRALAGIVAAVARGDRLPARREGELRGPPAG